MRVLLDRFTDFSVDCFGFRVLLSLGFCRDLTEDIVGENALLVAFVHTATAELAHDLGPGT